MHEQGTTLRRWSILHGLDPNTVARVITRDAGDNPVRGPVASSVRRKLAVFLKRPVPAVEEQPFPHEGALK